MTSEEVIKKLKWFREYNEDDFCGGDRIQDEYGDWYYRITEQDFEAFDMAIKALEQEPKTGHWILDETDNSITCDKCGCLIWANDISNGEAHYCPNCGAKMAESEEV